MSAPSAFCVLWHRDGSISRVQLHHADEIEAALQLYAGNAIGEERDTLLRLTGITGSRVVIMASAVYGFNISTPASRKADRDLDARITAEGTPPQDRETASQP